MRRNCTSVITIYAIRNKVNGKVYIGASQDVERRVRQHFQEKRYMAKISEGESFKGKLKPFEQDFKDMGQDAFEVYFLEQNVPPELRQEREAYWIAEYESANPRFGYNKYTENPVKCPQIKDGFPPNLSKKKED